MPSNRFFLGPARSSPAPAGATSLRASSFARASATLRRPLRTLGSHLRTWRTPPGSWVISSRSSLPNARAPWSTFCVPSISLLASITSPWFCRLTYWDPATACASWCGGSVRAYFRRMEFLTPPSSTARCLPFTLPTTYASVPVTPRL